MKHLVTIVIPCKNEEKYIGRLLQDLARQLFIGDTQIIIADDSTDNTRKVIREQKKLTGLNIRVIKGGPVSKAKNNGAKLVQTPYILFIDADVRFFSDRVIYDTVTQMWDTMGRYGLKDYELLGLKLKCYVPDIRAKIGFAAFNLINKIMSKKVPFAVGAYMLIKTDRFRALGGFPEKYVTSEDFFLSKMIKPSKFVLSDHYVGQDNRRFKKMGYFGMLWYLIRNFFNRNNDKYWKEKDFSKYWD